MMENNITKTLITLRESRNMSQAQLANLMGLNKNVMGRIERGLRSLRADEIVRLAKIFDVSTDFILGQNHTISNNGEESYHKQQALNKKDIARKIQDIISMAENEPDINFYGAPMTTENRKLLANALEVGLTLSQKKQNL